MKCAHKEITIDGVTYTLTRKQGGGQQEHQEHQEQQEQQEHQEGGAKKGKKKEKKAKGTRKLSPYMRFAQEARKKVLAQHPEWKSDIVKVGKEIGAMWRSMSEAEKAKY